jgi:hypothetical protein
LNNREDEEIDENFGESQQEYVFLIDRSGSMMG